jgi:hypothetical protein
MDSESEKWDYRTEISLKELLNSLIVQSHKGIIARVGDIILLVVSDEEASRTIGAGSRERAERFTAELCSEGAPSAG